MIGKKIKFYTKEYSELLLYTLLLASLIVHKAFDLPNLSAFFLLLPLAFVEIKLLDRWLFLWLFGPFVIFLGFEPLKIISLALFALSEEVFFRAYMMRRYGNLTVSFLFVLPHLILYQNLISLLTFFPSLVFGYIYLSTRSVSLVGFVHFLSNILYLSYNPPFFRGSNLMGFSI